MKKILIAAFMLFSAVLGVQADGEDNVPFTQNGTEFTQTITASQNGGKEIATGCTWTDSKGVKYDIYMSAKGRCYIYKISKKTGKQYKQYLPKEIDAQVAEQMNKK